MDAELYICVIDPLNFVQKTSYFFYFKYLLFIQSLSILQCTEIKLATSLAAHWFARKLLKNGLKNKIWNKAKQLNPCAALYRPASAQMLWAVSSWRSRPDRRLLWLLHSLLTSTLCSPSSKIKARPFKRIQDWLTDWYFSPFSCSPVCLRRT